MFSITKFLPLIAIAGALLVGFCAGYKSRDNTAEIERLELAQAALTAERNNLMEQLEVEHARQEAAQEAAERTAQELEAVSASYDSALDYVDGLLQRPSSGDRPAALPDDSASAAGAQGGQTDRCACENTASVRRLSERLLTVARDCEINDRYLKQCLRLYESLRQ